MLKTVLNSGSDISILGKAGLRHLQQHFKNITLVHPYEEGPSVFVADGRERNLTQHTTTPWAPLVVRLTVAILPGGDDTLVLGSKTLREKLHIDVMDGLRVRAQGQHELEKSGGTWATERGGVVSLKQVAVSLEAAIADAGDETAGG